MSRRRKYADGEQDELQTLKEQNQKLKREVSKLRKQIQRLDLDRFASFKEALDRIDEIEMEQAAKRKEKILKGPKWLCWHCSQDNLKMLIIERRDGIWYYRYCPNCKHRTKLQKYNESIET